MNQSWHGVGRFVGDIVSRDLLSALPQIHLCVKFSSSRLVLGSKHSQPKHESGP